MLYWVQPLCHVKCLLCTGAYSQGYTPGIYSLASRCYQDGANAIRNYKPLLKENTQIISDRGCLTIEIEKFHEIRAQLGFVRVVSKSWRTSYHPPMSTSTKSAPGLCRT